MAPETSGHPGKQPTFTGSSTLSCDSWLHHKASILNSHGACRADYAHVLDLCVHYFNFISIFNILTSQVCLGGVVRRMARNQHRKLVIWHQALLSCCSVASMNIAY